jgi:hypothetical protein
MSNPLSSNIGPATVGGLGGILPTVTNLASTYVAHPSTGLPELGMYYGLILFFLVGFVLCIGFSIGETKQALLTGIAAPAIITSIISGVTAGGPPTSAPIRTSLSSFFSFQAFAQPAQSVPSTMEDACVGPGDANAPSGILRIRFHSDYRGSESQSGQVVQVKTLKGEAWTTCTFETGVGVGRQIRVATALSALDVQYKNALAHVILDPKKNADVLVVIEPTWRPVIDFGYIVGGVRKYDVVSATITAIAYPGEYGVSVRFAGALSRDDIIAVAAQLRADGWKLVPLPQAGDVMRDPNVTRTEIQFNPNSPDDLTAATVVAHTIRQFRLTPQQVVATQDNNISAKELGVRIYLP